MSSLSLQILQAYESALAGTVNVGPRIFFDRPEAASRGELPALSILPDSEADEILTTTETLTSSLSFNVDILVSGSPLSVIADPILVDMHSKLMAADLNALKVISLYPTGRQWVREEGEVHALRCGYTVKHRTLLTDLSA